MKKRRKVNPMVEAYFCNYLGDILPVFHGTHIGEVIADPKVFGFRMEEIAETYMKHNEDLSSASEGYAREEIIKYILGRGFIRARIKQGYLYCQIGFESKRIYKNIMRLRQHLRLVLEPMIFRVLGLRVYNLEPEIFIIDAFDAQEAQEKLQERLQEKLNER